jgi:phospholipid transport system transporter-binding protein
MSSAGVVPRGDSGFGIEGVLDFTTVARLAAEGERMFSGRGRVEIDLQGVRAANSAGLALLLEWMEQARRRRIVLRFHNLPESIERLARLANLSATLPRARRDA